MAISQSQPSRASRSKYSNSPDGLVTQDPRREIDADVYRTVASSSERGFWYPGAYAMIGTPAGLLRNKKPRICLRKGDEISFHGSHGVGSLVHTICQKRGRGSPKGGEGDKDLSLA
jgi:hypothetical protein